ncbi:MAG: hypothetical protein RLZZ175_756 [Bacteroidota bacterium]|jgi:thiol-disulfide isomerase/thioredoxin
MLSLIKKCFVSVLLSAPFVLQAQSSKDVGYQIKGKIRGLVEKDTIYLANYYGDKQYLKDTALVDKSGSFIIDGKAKLDGGFYIIVLPKKKIFDLVITNEQKFSFETDTADLIKNMQFKDSKENLAFYEYLKYVGVKGQEVEVLKPQIKTDSIATTQKLIAIDKEVSEYRKSFLTKYNGYFVAKAFKATDEVEVPEAPKLPSGVADSTFPYRYYKSHYFDNIDLNDDNMLRTPIFHNKFDRFMTKVIPQLPDSVIVEADRLIAKTSNKEVFKYLVYYITNQAEQSKQMGMDAVFVHMYKKYYLSGRAYWVDTNTIKKIKERIEIVEPLLLGKKIPNAYLKDSLDNYKELWKVNGNFTVVFFYDPNCGHCQKEAPKLYEFYQKNKKNVAVYAASIERKDDDWKKFIVKNKYTDWINVWDKGVHTDFRKVFDVYSTPVIYVLDKDKKIIAKRLGVEQLQDFVDNYAKIHKIPMEKEVKESVSELPANNTKTTTTPDKENKSNKSTKGKATNSKTKK